MSGIGPLIHFTAKAANGPVHIVLTSALNLLSKQQVQMNRPS